MPADFNECVDKGGKVTTKVLSGGRYMHLCKDKNGKWHNSEVKTTGKGKVTKGAFERAAKKASG